jgi:Cu-Zn family superoxide dismutase
MRRLVLAVGACVSTVLVAVGLGAVTTGAQAHKDHQDEASARAVLRDTDGDRVGVVKITQERGYVRVNVAARGLPGGFHGFHVHTVGKCVPPFTSAGVHLNPTGATHGNHAGDMPVLYVMRNGYGEARFVTDRFTVAGLFDRDGSAIIVHAAADNYANIPARYHSHPADVLGPDTDTLATGDSGGRIACGVVRRSR